MSNPVWPSSLPGPLVDAVSYSPQSNVIRSQFPGGGKARRRSTRAYEDVVFQLVLSRAGVQVLQDFACITCADILPFLWVEFRDPAKAAAVYTFKARPIFSPLGTARLWRADVQLELRTPFNGMFPITNELGTQLATDTDEGLTT